MYKLPLLNCLTALVVLCFPMRTTAQFAYGPTGSNQDGFFDGYEVAGTGNFTPLAGSPFQGGNLNSMIAHPKSDLLYVYDAYGQIDTFKIASNGSPVKIGTPVPFSPPLAPGGEFVFASLSLISGNGKYVYILNDSTDDEGFAVATQLSVLRVQKDGSVTYNSKDLYDFDTVYSMVGDPTGKLIFGLTAAHNAVRGLSVAADGSLHPIPTPQFPNTTLDAIGLDLRGKYFYVVTGYSPQQLAVFSIGSNGALTPIPGSPFSDPQGRFNVFNQLAFDPNGKFVYSLGFLPADPGTVGVYAFQEQSNGQLVPITGSPFTLGSTNFAGNLVIDPKGRFLTVNDVGTGTIPANWVFEIRGDGSLKGRTNSPSPSIPAIETFVGK